MIPFKSYLESIRSKLLDLPVCGFHLETVGHMIQEPSNIISIPLPRNPKRPHWVLNVPYTTYRVPVGRGPLKRNSRYALILEQRAQQVFWLALTMLILPSQCPARASTLLAARNSVSEILET